MIRNRYASRIGILLSLLLLLGCDSESLPLADYDGISVQATPAEPSSPYETPAPVATRPELDPSIHIIRLSYETPQSPQTPELFQERYQVRIDPIEYREFSSVEVAVSPDAHYVVVNRGYQNQVIDIDSEQVEQVLLGHVAHTTSLSWAPDGEHIAASGETGLLTVWSTLTASIVWQTTLENTEIAQLAWSPDSSRLLIRTAPCSRCEVPHFENAGFWIGDLRTRTTTLHLPWPYDTILLGTWRPESDGVLYYGLGVPAFDLDLSSPSIRAEYSEFLAARAASWSPDGRYLASGGVRSQRGWFTILSQETLQPVFHESDTYTAGTLAWSPDSGMIAVSTGSEIDILKLGQSGHLERLETLPWGAILLWSNDGNRIVLFEQYEDPALVRVFEAVQPEG